MSNVYSIARQLQAPGVATVATFNPMRLTPKIRKAVRTSIATGVYKGGWTSQAMKVRRLVLRLADVTPSVFVDLERNYVTLIGALPAPEAVTSEIIGLLEADCTLQKMKYDDIEKNRYTPTREEFYTTIDKRHLGNVEKVKGAHGASRTSHYMVVREPKLRQQIADAFLTTRTSEDVYIAERVASMLDEDKEWNIPLEHRF